MMGIFFTLLVAAVVLWGIMKIIRNTFIVDNKTYVAIMKGTTVAAQQPTLRPLTPSEREALRQAEDVLDWNTADQIIRREYTGPLPYEVLDGMWSSLYPDTFSTKIAGINYHKAAARQLAGTTFNVTIKADPKNEYDKNAIKVVHSETKKHLGFIPAEETDDVRDFLHGKLPHSNCRAYIDEAEDTDFDTGRTRTYFTAKLAIKR